MLATRVEDRFGNYVTYSYTGTPSSNKLTTIESNDGRKITVTYTGDEITKVEADGSADGAQLRTWTYIYTGAHLTQVTLPSGLYWTIAVQNLVNAKTKPGLKLVCGGGWGPKVGWITHPYGAVGEYTLNEVAHGRTDVPYNFVSGAGTGSGGCIGEHVRYQRSFDTMSLTSKKLTGPGLDDMTWTYSYSQTQGGWTTSTGVSDVNTTTVTDPEGHKTIHHFDRTWTWKEGAEVKTEIYDGVSTLLRTVEKDYVVGPLLGGIVGTGDNENPIRYPRSLDERVITENGNTFTKNYTYDYDVAPTIGYCYDYPYKVSGNVQPPRNDCYSYGRPVKIVQSNSIPDSHSRTDDIYYFTDQNKWLITFPGKTKVGSETLSEIGYDDDYNADVIKQYDVTVATREYLSSGLIDWEENAIGDRHTFSNWYRGMPETISYPDLVSRTSTIDYFGNVKSVTDRAGHTTEYDYDIMDRLIKITYPLESSGPERLPLVLSYAKVTASEYGDPNAGLVANQWKVTTQRYDDGPPVVEEDLVTTSYLDAMLRQVLLKTEDITDMSGDLDRFGRTDYDSASRPTFQSFPSADIEADEGTDTTYDGLGRVKEIEENVTPFAKTTYDYLANNVVEVTNPRGKETTTKYFALGSPIKDLPIQIDQEENISTEIDRNKFGEMTKATQYDRAGTDSVVREFRYDDSHRLCRQIDPESGSTVYWYNAAGQLDWYSLAASGGTNACNETAVLASEKIDNTYNTLGQLTNVNYPDNSPDLTYTYDDNGNLATLNSSSANWTYQYNKVNALTQEELVTNSQTFYF